MNDKKKTILNIALCFLMIVLIAVLIHGFVFKSDNKEADSAENTVAVETEQDTLFVEVEKTVTSEMIQESLNDMGKLITEEYDFTQVETYEKTKTILKIFTSNSNFIYSYDGTVTAGIDFEDIVVEKDDGDKIIYISLPASSIQNVDIDYESFQMYSEQEGIWNAFTPEDYNDAMVEFENLAEERAKEKGVLEKADENARNVVENFVAGLIDTSEYTIEWR